MGAAMLGRPRARAAFRLPSAVARALGALASLWWTLAWMGVTAAILAHGLATEAMDARWLALPCGGLFVNLAAALVTNEKLHRQPGLLVFHVGLAVLALAAAGGRLTAMTGSVEVTQGGAFDPALVNAKAGPLHPWALGKITFVQGPFRIDYDAGLQRRHTNSTVFVPTAGGGWDEVTVGDDRPLKMFGYRFYTTPNKGFALLLTHIGADGQRRTGAVHLPSYPMHDYKQANSWAMPDGPELELWLDLPTPVATPEQPWSFRVPDDATLVVGLGARRHELKPGQEVRIGDARLRYEELRAWMGYTVFFDPTLPWLAAAVLVACAGLGWHAVAKIRAVAGDADA
ncbi:cytochrome c biogenesis protein ResB [Azospirillum sp.]|uniref:cytochrome c biogenesis protein ResB n=1 Tax=Azospirillum sp. TaxID=34012 RepID=UPI003D731936